MDKYSALHNHLLNLEKDNWKAEFSEIEKLLGFKLPKSARHYPAWWANNRQNSRHTKAWLDAGWQAGDVNFGSETVMFYRHGKPLLMKGKQIKRMASENPNNEPYNWDETYRLECRLEMAWMPLGRVTLEQGRLLFPKAERTPAIYRFRIRHKGKESIYIGETDNLQRRFGNYRNPGPSQKTSLRINATLKEALNEGAEIAIAAITTNVWIDTGNGLRSANLDSKVTRCLFENAAIADNGGRNIEMLNKAQI